MTMYPKWVYHKEHAADGLCVMDAEHEPSGEGWVSTPAAFDPGYVAPPVLEEEVIVRGGRPLIPFPTWRYHANGDAKLIETAEADEQLDKSQWKDSPAAFAPKPVNATPPTPAPPVLPRLVDRKPKDKE